MELQLVTDNIMLKTQGLETGQLPVLIGQGQTMGVGGWEGGEQDQQRCVGQELEIF